MPSRIFSITASTYSPSMYSGQLASIKENLSCKVVSIVMLSSGKAVASKFESKPCISKYFPKRPPDSFNSLSMNNFALKGNSSAIYSGNPSGLTLRWVIVVLNFGSAIFVRKSSISGCFFEYSRKSGTLIFPSAKSIKYLYYFFHKSTFFQSTISQTTKNAGP